MRYPVSEVRLLELRSQNLDTLPINFETKLAGTALYYKSKKPRISRDSQTTLLTLMDLHGTVHPPPPPQFRLFIRSLSRPHVIYAPSTLSDIGLLAIFSESKRGAGHIVDSWRQSIYSNLQS